MTITETLLNSHRFTNALFTKIASTLSLKSPSSKKGLFVIHRFPAYRPPFYRDALRPVTVTPGRFFRILFPFSSFSPKGNRSGFLSARFPDRPGIPRPAVRNQSSSGGQPAATRHEKTVRKDISNISKTRAPRLCLHETATGTCASPTGRNGTPCRFFRHQPFRNKSVPCPDTLPVTGACGN